MAECTRGQSRLTRCAATKSSMSTSPEARCARWRQIARFGTSLAAVILIVAAIMAVTLYSYRSNRTDALVLSQDLVGALDQRVQGEVENCLEPVGQAVRTPAGM